jgi:hypothetical protein
MIIWAVRQPVGHNVVGPANCTPQDLLAGYSRAVHARQVVGHSRAVHSQHATGHSRVVHVLHGRRELWW